MKKLFVTIVGLAVGFYACAQSTALFRIKNLPGHTYTAVAKMGLNIETNYEGDAAMISKIKASGVQLPIVMRFENTLKADLKTSLFNTSKDLPFSLSLQQNKPKLTVGGKATFVPEKASGYLARGKFDATGKASMQTVQGKKMTDSLKLALLTVIKNMETDIEFPKPALKAGDSFAQEEDMAVPIPGFNASMLLRTTYKLVAIANGKGIFNMDFVASINTASATDGAKMNGTGTGKLVFDINGNHVESINQTINMTFVRPMPKQGIAMRGTAQTTMSEQVSMK